MHARHRLPRSRSSTRRRPEACCSASALEVGPDAAASTTSAWPRSSGRGWRRGVVSSEGESRSRRGSARRTRRSETVTINLPRRRGTTIEETSSLEPVPGLYARLSGDGGSAGDAQAFDWSRSSACICRRERPGGSFVSSTMGVRMRLAVSARSRPRSADRDRNRPGAPRRAADDAIVEGLRDGAARRARGGVRSLARPRPRARPSAAVRSGQRGGRRPGGVRVADPAPCAASAARSTSRPSSWRSR